MSKQPTSFSVALTSLITRLYDGNRTALSRECGIPAPTLYTLCKPTVSPSKARLRALGKVVSESERRQLLLAAAQDVIPGEYQDEVIANGGAIGRSKLPEELAKVIRFLEDEAIADAESAGMLRSIGRWAGILGYVPGAKDSEGYAPEGEITLHIDEDESSGDSFCNGGSAS
jgi:hypothetical protein